MKIVLALSRPDMVTILKTARDGHGGTATPAAAERYHKRLLEICKRIVEQSDQRHCVVCGCTDNRACPGGCSWVMIHRKTPTGVCSKCWGRCSSARSMNPTWTNHVNAVTLKTHEPRILG